MATWDDPKYREQIPRQRKAKAAVVDSDEPITCPRCGKRVYQFAANRCTCGILVPWLPPLKQVDKP